MHQLYPLLGSSDAAAVGNTQRAAPCPQCKVRSLARGGLPASPLALQGRWLLTGTGCSHTCWASPPPPQRSHRCCIQRRISCAAAAARCSSRRQGRRRCPGIPPRPPAASSGRWHSPAAPGGSPAPAPRGTPALRDSGAAMVSPVRWRGAAFSEHPPPQHLPWSQRAPV